MQIKTQGTLNINKKVGEEAGLPVQLNTSEKRWKGKMLQVWMFNSGKKEIKCIRKGRVKNKNYFSGRLLPFSVGKKRKHAEWFINAEANRFKCTSSLMPTFWCSFERTCFFKSKKPLNLARQTCKKRKEKKAHEGLRMRVRYGKFVCHLLFTCAKTKTVSIFKWA